MFAEPIVWRYDVRLGEVPPVVVFREQWDLSGGRSSNELRVRTLSSSSQRPPYRLEYRTKETDLTSGFGTQVSVQVLRDDLDYFGTHLSRDRTTEIVWYSVGSIVMQLQFLDATTAPPELLQKGASNGQIPAELFWSPPQSGNVDTAFSQCVVSESMDRLECDYVPDARSSVRVREHATFVRNVGTVALTEYIGEKQSMTLTLISAELLPKVVDR